MLTAPFVSRRNAIKAAITAGAAALVAGNLRAGADVYSARPPLGWNSWDSFAATITEKQAIEVAHAMARQLLPSGYRYFTIDIQWYEPGATGFTYRDGAPLTMDSFGRLQPAVNRFPSAANGQGFAPLARQVHALGLKFGLHLLRGIPRQAVAQRLPVLGADVTAADIADTNSTCAWNSDMYGVDMRKPGAQSYYDSVFAQFAQWGVDFVKVDDLSRPYAEHRPEIEAIHRAIARTGRSMLLSMSPGPTPPEEALHARTNSQMWRISDDFWDEWSQLDAQFDRLATWAPHAAPGGWPDADMLPLGMLDMGRRTTRLSRDEQMTLINLWSIARSPLIMGGDLRKLDPWTRRLLTNRDVLAVNQRAHASRPLFSTPEAAVWVSTPDSGRGTYVGLFNRSGKSAEIRANWSANGGVTTGRAINLWTRAQIGLGQPELAVTLPPHGSALFHAL